MTEHEHPLNKIVPSWQLTLFEAIKIQAHEIGVDIIDDFVGLETFSDCLKEARFQDEYNWT